MLLASWQGENNGGRGLSRDFPPKNKLGGRLLFKAPKDILMGQKDTSMSLVEAHAKSLA